MSKLLRCGAIFGFALFLNQAAAWADTFNLVLTPTSGTEGGTGSFTFNGPAPKTGIFNFGTQDTGASLLTALSFNFVEAGKTYTFDLSDKTGKAYGQLLNGSLYDVTYQGTLVNIGVQLDLSLQANGLEYSFADLFHSSYDSSGTITATPVSAVPEPQSAALLMTILGALLFPLRRMFARRA
jgi:hypothetical protein